MVTVWQNETENQKPNKRMGKRTRQAAGLDLLADLVTEAEKRAIRDAKRRRTEREAAFNAAVASCQTVTMELIAGCCSAALVSGSSGSAVSKQVATLRSMQWVVVSELATRCHLFPNSKTEAESLKHVCAAVRDETRRLGSPGLVVDLLSLLATRLDAVLAEHPEVTAHVGSVREGLDETFALIKDLLAKKRALVLAKQVTEQAQTRKTRQVLQEQQQTFEPFRIARPAELAKVLAGLERENKNKRVRLLTSLQDISPMPEMTIAPSAITSCVVVAASC